MDNSQSRLMGILAPQAANFFSFTGNCPFLVDNSQILSTKNFGGQFPIRGQFPPATTQVSKLGPKRLVFGTPKNIIFGVTLWMGRKVWE